MPSSFLPGFCENFASSSGENPGPRPTALTCLFFFHRSFHLARAFLILGMYAEIPGLKILKQCACRLLCLLSEFECPEVEFNYLSALSAEDSADCVFYCFFAEADCFGGGAEQDHVLGECVPCPLG